METDIGAGVNLIKVSGNSFTSTREGPSGTEYVFNFTGIEQDPFGMWNFSISNANEFPVSFSWAARVYSDVYPQAFAMALSTDASNESVHSYSPPGGELKGVFPISIKEGLESILVGAPVAYTSTWGSSSSA